VALTEQEWFRQMLGESIPTGGTDADTMFTDVQVQEFIDRGTSAEHSIYLGWQAKAAELSTMVNTTEGQTRLDMGVLFDHAMKQVAGWEAAAGVGGTGRGVRIKSLRRS
jgi:hypothetical protein